MTACSPYQFSVFRIYLGSYVLFIFLSSLASSADIWSSEGIVPGADLNLTYGVFPNILNHYDSPSQIRIFLFILSFLSILFITGIGRRWTALLLWYGWTCLLNRNNMILNPAIHYTGWLLLACTIIPSGEPWSFIKGNKEWVMPKLIITGAWIVFATGYFAGGIDKFYSASWMDGTAVKKIMLCPLGYNSNKIFIDLLPGVFFHFLNWFVIIAEIACLPLAIFSRTRIWSWLMATVLQVGILLTLDITPIVIGMLALHLLIFDKSWFAKKVFKSK